MSTERLLAVARGQEKADLVVVNGSIVNVYTGEIYPGGVAVCGLFRLIYLFRRVLRQAALF